jgi:hypothetical protein
MKKTSLIIMLMGVSAVGMSAVPAFALTFEPALWLDNGSDVLELTSTDQEGGITLENVLNGAAILCEGIFDGSVGPEGESEITSVLLLSGTLLPSLDETGATGGWSCTGVNLCSTGSEEWPLNLPWHMNLVEDEGVFYDELLTAAGYFILCLTILGTVEELCEDPIGSQFEVLNVAGGVEFMGAGSLNGPCGTNANEGKQIVDAGNLMLFTTAGLGPLAASLP